MYAGRALGRDFPRTLSPSGASVPFFYDAHKTRDSACAARNPCRIAFSSRLKRINNDARGARDAGDVYKARKKARAFVINCAGVYKRRAGETLFLGSLNLIALPGKAASKITLSGASRRRQGKAGTKAQVERPSGRCSIGQGEN